MSAAEAAVARAVSGKSCINPTARAGDTTKRVLGTDDHNNLFDVLK